MCSFVLEMIGSSMNSLTPAERELVNDELNLDDRSITTQALIKLRNLSNENGMRLAAIEYLVANGQKDDYLSQAGLFSAIQKVVNATAAELCDFGKSELDAMINEASHF